MDVWIRKQSYFFKNIFSFPEKHVPKFAGT